MTELQKNIFEAISKNDFPQLKSFIAQLKDSVDFVDDNGMTPLQHACYKGQKEAVQLLLDQGANVNSGNHEYKYTALHFAGLSGNCDVCFMLLEAGADPNAVNTVGRTAGQMAAFVSNHSCVATINNFVPKATIEVYTRPSGPQSEIYLPPILLDPFHKFVVQINMHPIRIALNLHNCPAFQDNVVKMKKVLDMMTEREMKRPNGVNEILGFKYHYLGFVLDEIIKCQEHIQKRKDQGANFKKDYVELFAKSLLKEDKTGFLDVMDQFIKKCVRAFPFYECTLFRQLVTQLTNKEFQGSALEVISTAINGQRGFKDTIIPCSTCGHENPEKKCSKCKEVQYCDRECQRLHWFMHKQTCARPVSNSDQQNSTTTNQKQEIDTAELSEQLQKLVSK